MNPANSKRKVLAIDDSLMLLSFVRDTLTEAGYDVATAPTSAEGLKAAADEPPDLILLDYVLPGMKGDDLVRELLENTATAKVPVLYMSGLGAQLRPDSASVRNVIGFLNKPFTSDLLIKTVETHMPKAGEEPKAEPEPEPMDPAPESEPVSFPPPEAQEDNFLPAENMEPQVVAEPVVAEPVAAPAPTEEEEWWSAPQSTPDWTQPAPAATSSEFETVAQPDESELPTESITGGTFFCGDTRFFSLNWALRTISRNRLTGSLRLFWHKEPVDLLAQNGQIVLVTTRDADLYCSETPITVANVDLEKLSAARAQQGETGIPMFLALAQDNSILREPAVQLVQHYGQKLFAHLWTAKRVRFVFENTDLPMYGRDLPGESDVDNWALATLRTVQFQDLGEHANYEVASIPAYTKDGFERIQNLRLTVAEAQFASQFNGVRSLQQIAKNLRLDLKFARVTLFRFIALEIVECWPATAVVKPEGKGLLQRLSRTIGIGE